MRNIDLVREGANAIVCKMVGGAPYTFHREGVFYPLVLQSDEEAKANGECNPGTLRVVNELTGDVVWEPKQSPSNPQKSTPAI